MNENDSVFLLYRSDQWMSTSSMELIGVFNNGEALSDTVRDELSRITHECNDFDPAQWNVRKCFGKWVKKELEEAREKQIESWLDYFAEHNQTPTLEENLNLEVWTLNEAA